MTRRVIIQSTGGAPLRVSVAGADAASAQFGNLIFDGNQPPLRLAQNGYLSMAQITDYAASGTPAQTVAESSPVSLAISVPAGATPIFMVAYRQPYTTTPNSSASGAINHPGIVRTPCRWASSFGQIANTEGIADAGSGGAICNGNQFIGITHTPNHWNGYVNTFSGVYINYAIFRNYL